MGPRSSLDVVAKIKFVSAKNLNTDVQPEDSLFTNSAIFTLRARLLTFAYYGQLLGHRA
jgi:hypothetical protein